MNVKTYNQTGNTAGTLEIPESIFGLKWNADLVHQVVESERSNQRKKVAHVKMRGEVSGGGKKPWQQKGTGRARHGSTRSPLWRTGGVTHGPNPMRKYDKKINKKIARKALATILSAKLRENEILFLDALTLADHKTKNAVAIFNAFSEKKEYPKMGQKGGKTLILLPRYDTKALRAVRNIKSAHVKEAAMIQSLDLLSHKYIVIPKESVAVLDKKNAKASYDKKMK